MNSLIIYDTFFGDTLHIAEAIADALAAYGSVRLVRADKVGARDLDTLDLLLVGGPTQRHGLSPALRDWLGRLPRGALRELPVATFDTRYRMASWLSGSAARDLAKALRRQGAALLVPPASFFVTAREGPLAEGQLARAGSWARMVYEVLTTRRHLVT
jgi:flavodoxin